MGYTNASSLTCLLGSWNVSLAENSVFWGYPYILPPEFFKHLRFSKSKGDNPLSLVRWRCKEGHCTQCVVSTDWTAAQRLFETGPGVMSDLCSQVALADPNASVFMEIHTWTSILHFFNIYTHVLFCSATIPKHQLCQPGLQALGTQSFAPHSKPVWSHFWAQTFRMHYPLSIFA